MGVVAGRWIPFIPVSMTTLTSPRPHHENELAQERSPTIDKSGIASYYNYSSEADVQVADRKEIQRDLLDCLHREN